MVPTIEPTLTIPIEANPDGSQPIPHFEFAEDPPALYIVKSVWNDPPVKILWWHAPTGAVLALPVALALLCWCGRRFWNRPRAIGLLYCRNCNHELTPPNAARGADGNAAWLSESAKCPECGWRSARPPLIGTSLSRRLVPTLLSGALVAACCLILCGSLRPVSRSAVGREMTWPWPGLEKSIGNWALTRRMSGYSGQVNRIVRVPLDGTSSQTVFRGSVSNWDGGFVSPDGRYVLNVQFGDRSNTLFINCRGSGRRSEIRFAEGKFAWVRTVGYSADSRLAYVHVSTYDKVTPDRLYSVELETGELHRIADVDLHIPDRPNMTSWPWTKFVIRDKDDQLTWAHVELTFQSGVDNGIATIPNGTSLRQFKFQTMIGRPMDLDIHWLPARRWLSISSTDSTLSTLVDTRSEETRSDYVYFPFQGKELAVYAQQDIEGYRILNKARKQLGVLGGAGWASERSLTFSRDGRWAAAYVDVSPRVSNSNARTSWQSIQGEIWIWDLSLLFETDAESTASPANDR